MLSIGIAAIVAGVSLTALFPIVGLPLVALGGAFALVGALRGTVRVDATTVSVVKGQAAPVFAVGDATRGPLGEHSVEHLIWRHPAAPTSSPWQGMAA